MQHFNTHSFLSGRSQLLVGLVLGIATTLALSAMADGDPTTDDVPRTLPYQGRLELNGEPINATGDDALHIMFELYDGPTANVPTYRQSLVVEVYAGRFTATIGPSGLDANDAEVFIDDIIANADDLQLGMVLLGDPQDPADDIPLANRQRLHASPYAIWTTSATNFNVARNLNVGGDATVTGTLSADAINTHGGDIAGGDIHANRNLNASDDIVAGGTITAGENIIANGIISGNFQFNVEGEFTVSVDGSTPNGAVERNLGSKSRRLCFLTKAAYKDLDLSGEQGECRVIHANNIWRLQATVRFSSNGNAFCGAHCITW